MQQHKYKLSMWLLYKSKNAKVNGCSLISEREDDVQLSKYVTLILNKIKNSDAILSLVNRYVNLNFNQQLPEDLPHISTWILSAQAYITISSCYASTADNIDESQVLQDIIKVGERVLDYVQHLAGNKAVMQQLNTALLAEFMKIQDRATLLQTQHDSRCLLNMDQIYQELRCLPYQWLAASSRDEQLEHFTPITVDVSGLFEQHIMQHIPAEFFAAQYYGLGQLRLNFCVPAAVNIFNEVHMPYGNEPLPDSARDVLYKIEVYFKYTDSDRECLLSSSWFAHDLGTATQRFENYYNNKFKYKLKHNRYNWISLDGRSNQVEGHGNTNTHKLIDYERLAKLYKEWLVNATPIDDNKVAQRVKQNPQFMQLYSEIFAAGTCTIAKQQQIELLRAGLHNQLSRVVLQQRTNLVMAMQQDMELMAAIAKIDALYAVFAVFARLLNESFKPCKLNDKFMVLASELQQVQFLTVNFNEQMNKLFECVSFANNTGKDYAQGAFYGRIHAVLTQLRILQTEHAISRLRVF